MKTRAQKLGITEFPYREYNASGKLIYWESSNGLWEKFEYDTSDNEIYWETSNGLWEKFEYDTSGKLIYFEDCDGLIKDNRGQS